MVIRDGERMLWNPLKKQPYRFRPEERVRLQFLDYLMLQSDIPASRIAVESPIPSRFSRGRTDLLCYDRQFQPWLLIECKAEKVKLGPNTATQSATYNRFIKAPFIMLTNGVQDALFQVTSSLQPLDYNAFPSEFRHDSPFINKNPDYWKERGFLPVNMPDPVASPLADRLSLLFHTSSETQSYLSLTFPSDHMPLSHYYLLLPAPKNTDVLLAVTIFALNPDEAVICAIANRNNRNTACLRLFISAEGKAYSPQLFLTGNADIVTPDTSKLESIWLVPEGPPENMVSSSAHDPHGDTQTPVFLDELAGILAELLLHD